MAGSFVGGAFRACQVPGFGVKHAGAAQVCPGPRLRFPVSGLPDGVLNHIGRQCAQASDCTGMEAAICVNDGRVGRDRLPTGRRGEQRQQARHSKEHTSTPSVSGQRGCVMSKLLFIVAR